MSLFLKQIQSLTKELGHFYPRSRVTHSCDPLDSRGKTVFNSQVGLCCCSRGVRLRLRLASSHSHSLTLPRSLYSGALASSHCGAGSNVTGPGCSVLPSLYKGPISTEAYHHTGSLGREGAVCERRGKYRDLGSQSGRPPAAYRD